MLYDDEMPLFLRQVWAGAPLRPEAQHPEHTLIDADFMTWAWALPGAVNTWTVNEVEEAPAASPLWALTPSSERCARPNHERVG